MQAKTQLHEDPGNRSSDFYTQDTPHHESEVVVRTRCLTVTLQSRT